MTIGELSSRAQAKLLRILQDGQVRRVGENMSRRVDVRIIAATNRDLDAMVRAHEFRADLFHRLNVLSIRIPALRERPEDIEPLVQHFISRCAEQSEHPAMSASRQGA